MPDVPLSDFAKTRKGQGVAWLETIPEFPEILEGWKAGLGPKVIRQWLVEVKGYPPEEVTESRVGNQMRRRYPRG